MSYTFRYQVLYTSFERQIKCISNLESAVSVTVYGITVSTQFWKVKSVVQLARRGIKNERRQTKNVW